MLIFQNSLCISCFCSGFDVFSRKKLDPYLLLPFPHISNGAGVNLIIGGVALRHLELKRSKNDVRWRVSIGGISNSANQWVPKAVAKGLQAILVGNVFPSLAAHLI